MDPEPAAVITAPAPKVEPVKNDTLPRINPLTQHFARKYAAALQTKKLMPTFFVVVTPGCSPPLW